MKRFFKGVELARGGHVTKGATPPSFMLSCFLFCPIMDVGSQPRDVDHEPTECLQDVARSITHITPLVSIRHIRGCRLLISTCLKGLKLTPKAICEIVETFFLYIFLNLKIYLL